MTDESIAYSPTLTVAPTWYRSITRSQWNALFAAQAGWMLDAMDFVLYLMAIPALQLEFGFGPGTAGLLATVALFSSAFGGVLFGVIADKFGRTKALMGTVLIYSICSALTATAQTVGQLILWRTLLGLGMGGEWSAGAVLVSESWPPEHRGKAIGIMQSGWAIGYILAAIVAAIVLPTLGWRCLFIVGILPAFLVLWIRRNVPEPEIWASRAPESRSLDTFLSIFKPGIVHTTLFATLVSAAVMFGYWGLFSWMPAFLASPIDKGGAGLSIVKSTAWIIPMQIGAFIGYSSFGFIADRFGRRPTFIAFLLAAAVLVPFYGQMVRTPLLLMLLGPLVGMFGHGYFSVFGAMLAELFPTGMRATGQGFTYNAGRAASALAPFVIGTLAATKGIGSALGFTSLFFVLGSLLILLMPETRGKVLDS